MIQAICFDWGDTLSDSRIFKREAERKALEEIRRTCPLSVSSERITALISDAWREVDEKSFSDLLPQQSGEAMIRIFCRTLLCSMGGGCNNQIVEQVYHSFLEGIALAPSLFPDVRASIIRLKEHGLKLSVISNNIREYVNPPLANLGLEPCFDQVTISGVLGSGKPGPEIFLSTLKALNVESAQALMVGDSLTDDISGAAGVGMKTCWLNRNNSPLPSGIQPDCTIKDISELFQWLGSFSCEL